MKDDVSDLSIAPIEDMGHFLLKCSLIQGFPDPSKIFGPLLFMMVSNVNPAIDYGRALRHIQNHCKVTRK